MNKHIISALLALVMALSLAACGKTQTGSQSGDEQITLTLGVNGKANVTEWDNNKLVLWLEEMTGYNLEVEVFSADAGERATQVSTIVAGGDKLPDVMFYFKLSDDMIGNAKVDILTYAKEMRAEFISGELDVENDAEWQKYVDNIHRLGWDDAIAASQAAWDRMNGK